MRVHPFLVFAILKLSFLLPLFSFLANIEIGVEACLHEHEAQREVKREAQGPPKGKERSTSLVVKPNHVGFTVSSIKESLKFWEGVLGVPVLYTYVYPLLPPSPSPNPTSQTSS
jgi:hypothetical protein